MLSLQENFTPYLYSYAWQHRKTSPRIIVNNRNPAKPLWFPLTIYACATVIVTPEASRSRVLTSGRPQASSTWVPSGGQTAPTEIAGIRLKWKNPQKNAKKSITSDRIKSSIPRRSPRWTFLVWYPSLDSVRIDMNQDIIVKNSPRPPKCITSALDRKRTSISCRCNVSGTRKTVTKNPTRWG